MQAGDLMTAGSLEQHAARIRALDARWLEAAMRRDVDGMMAIYAADAQ
jgi:ketosteroid isomerase-like protein